MSRKKNRNGGQGKEDGLLSGAAGMAGIMSFMYQVLCAWYSVACTILVAYART